ncbi:MAG: class I SAM-dependent methyltransferase [Rudaea sp.]
MAEIRSGLRHVLSIAAVYDAFQTVVGAYAWHRRVLSHHVLPKLRKGAMILDIGCGTAEVLRHLPEDVHYHGFDRNGSYVAKAEWLFAKRQARFDCEEFGSELPDNGTRYDLILAIGLMHHLDDDDCMHLVTTAHNALADGGMMVTFDPVFTDDQSRIARFLIAHDRGRNVRRQNEYARLARTCFPHVEEILDQRPMFIPYTGLVLICRRRQEHSIRSD